MHKDKVKSTTKSTTNGGLKEEKRKIAKENGVDEKKSEKKLSTKSSSNGKSEKEKTSESKSKTDSKSTVVRNGKSVQKTPSIDKSEKKRSTSIEKRSISVEKRSSVDKSDEKRTKEKVSLKSKELTKPKEVTKLKEATKSNDATRSKVAKIGESSSVAKSVSKRSTAPLKASHAIVVKTNAPTSISSKNVMNQVHNVTVSSPPPVRRDTALVEMEPEQRTEQTVMEHEQLQRQKYKEQQRQKRELEERQRKEQEKRIRQQMGDQENQQAKEQQNGQQSEEPAKRGRTLTRTLEENEIVLLKPKPNGESMPLTNGSEPQSLVSESTPVEIKPAVSFEVMLDNANKVGKPHVKTKSSERIQSPVTLNGNDASENESEDYEDDFESYESDFESEVTDEEDDEDDEEEEEESQDETSLSSGKSDTDDNVVSTASRHPFETGHSIENSEFDSGSFEMKVLSSRARERNEERGKIDSTAPNHRIEVQNDSGIENFSNTANALIPTQNGQMNSLELNNKTFDNISDIENEGVNSLDAASKGNSGKINKTKSRLAKRGEELLNKITLDNMNYVLFDYKPIPYEVFMKIYGNSNTVQVAVQTHNDRIDQECQSDVIATRTSWSQYPISFYTEHIERTDFDDYKIGCGSVTEQNIDGPSENLDKTCEYSLNLIQSMTVKMNSSNELKEEKDNKTILNIDYDNLNRFLLESEMTLSRIFNVHVQKRWRKLNEPILPISSGFLTLNPKFNLANKRIHRTFATDALPGFLFTLHRESGSELNVIAMWNLISLRSPVCLLSVWSKVLCLEIHPKIKDIVFAGLDDG